MRARYYDPGMGRFLAVDPADYVLGNPIELNRYGYTANNPSNHTDPSGYGIVDRLKLTATSIATFLTASYHTAYNLGVNINRYIYTIVIPLTCFTTELLIDGYESGIECAGTPTDEIGDLIGKPGRRLWRKLADVLGSGRRGGGDAVEEVAENADDVLDDVIDAAEDAVPSNPGRNADELGDLVGAMCSFSEDTLVETEDGEKAISEVEEGEYVLAYNEETGETGYYEVTDVWAHDDPVIVHLIIDGELIETTPEHPFYTEDGEWIPAGELEEGDEIVSSDGETGTVESIEFITETQTMYNFTVDEAHTYFVGEGEWLVHNDCIVRYGELDSLGRPTGVRATLSHPLPDGSKATYDPPLYGGGARDHNRGHLLGRDLGGSGSDPRNIVTLWRGANYPEMYWEVENPVKIAVENGQTVEYSVTPIYEGNNLVATGLWVEAKGSGGTGIPLNIYRMIFNNPF